MQNHQLISAQGQAGNRTSVVISELDLEHNSGERLHSMHTLLADLVPRLRENPRSHLVGGIIPDEFHSHRCCSAPTRKKRTTIFQYQPDCMLRNRPDVPALRIPLHLLNDPPQDVLLTQKRNRQVPHVYPVVAGSRTGFKISRLKGLIFGDTIDWSGAASYVGSDPCAGVQEARAHGQSGGRARRRRATDGPRRSDF